MNEYKGAYECFDLSKITTRPIAQRANKVKLDDLVDLTRLSASGEVMADSALAAVAEAVRAARADGKPVICFVGAHPVKLGLSPIIIDLMERGMLTHVAGNGATAIHDFELALIGETSENVPNALPQGTFGMAHETGKHINDAIAAGFRRGLGLGESLGRMILGEPMPERVSFEHPENSIFAAGVRLGMPVTVHVGIGADIIDQHPGFDGAAKGGTSGFDFRVYAASVARLVDGGVVLNIGSAVTGPEVFLKAVSMAANVGRAPNGIVTANFDLRPAVREDVADEDKPTYYFRDHKSVVTRIPAAFNGAGHHVQGNFKETLPALYKSLLA